MHMYTNSLILHVHSYTHSKCTYTHYISMTITYTCTYAHVYKLINITCTHIYTL